MKDPFLTHGAAVVAVAVCGLGLVRWLFPEGGWQAPFSGVALSVATGAMGLVFKRFAVKHSLGAAFGVVAAVFFVRLVAVTVGLFVVMERGLSVASFVAGFFGSYIAVQIVEVSYVLAESKRLGHGG